MISLFLDTSLEDVSIALVKDHKLISSITKTTPNEHSIYTVSYLKKILAEANLLPQEIDKIIAVNGPGSFTGIRIGLTIAKVYAHILNKKIIMASSLKIMALSLKTTEPKPILSIIDAKHDNYYLGLYDENYNEIIPEQFNKKTFILELIEKYHPQLVSNQNFTIDNYQFDKINLDIPNIINYYTNKPSINPALANPNYLKAPQPLEEKK